VLLREPGCKRLGKASMGGMQPSRGREENARDRVPRRDAALAQARGEIRRGEREKHRWDAAAAQGRRETREGGEGQLSTGGMQPSREREGKLRGGGNRLEWIK
jgi:hypothetical protein